MSNTLETKVTWEELRNIHFLSENKAVIGNKLFTFERGDTMNELLKDAMNEFMSRDYLIIYGYEKVEEDYIDEYTGFNYGPMETYHVTDVIEDLYSIWETDDEEPPFGDPNDPTDYPREGEREEMPDHDMGEMYGVPYGASAEEALKHFESRKNKRRPIKETMDTFDGVCPYCGNHVDPESTECGFCGLDLSDYDECQTDDVDYEGSPDDTANDLFEQGYVKELLYDIIRGIQNLDGGKDLIDMHRDIFNRGDTSLEELEDLASDLSEYGYEDQAEKIWNYIEEK